MPAADTLKALEEAGRMKGVVMSPGDEYNGWLKWVAKNKRGGVVTFPTRAGQEALKLGLNHPMGPFELVDLVGLDTRLNILEYLHKSLGEKYRPAPLLVQYVKAGRLGRKSGRGVYEYPEPQPKN